MASYTKVDGGVVFRCVTSKERYVDIRLDVCTSCILRFRLSPDPELKDVESLLEIRKDWPSSRFNVYEKAESIYVDTGVLTVEIEKDPWRYLIYDGSGKVVLQENTRDLDAHKNYRSLPLGFTTKNGKFYRSNETFSLFPGESFYGFGEKFTKLNKVGQRIRCWNTNPFGAGTEESYKNIPFFMSTRGYGIFVNSTYPIVFEMGSRSLMTYTIMVEDPRLDLFIIYGPSLKKILARYEEITGWPSLPPKESFGIWHTPPWIPAIIHPSSSGEGICNWEEYVESTVSIAKKFRELDIPVDYFMAVGFGLTLSQTREICEKLGKLAVKVGLYVAPLLNLGTDMEREAREHGYALKREDGTPYEIPLGMKITGEIGETEYSLAMVERDEAWRWRHNRAFYASCLMPDFTNPEAVKWWKGKIAEYMKAGCFGVAMSDFGEDVPADACYHNGRPGREMHNLYTLLYQKVTYEAVAESTGHRGLVNARSGYAGMQRYPICWSGDPNCKWEDLLASIRAGLSIGLSGVPFWSCDTGGYQSEVGDLTADLWIRWSQWSMFTSHVRLHGDSHLSSDRPVRVPWTFGDKAVEIFRRYAKLRYRLLPYIYSQAYVATKTGLPLMRAMVLEFQEDPNTHNIEDQYMFGEAFLVAPVYSPDNERTVYLPEGVWFDYWTSREYKGPTILHLNPPLEVLPLYVKGDSIIPMGPDMSYVGEKPFNPITLDIWLCSEAEAILYDDDETTRCRMKRREDEITLELEASKKTYIAKFNKTKCPLEVTLNGVDIPRLDSLEDLGQTSSGWYFDPSFTVYVKFDASGKEIKLTLRA
ncbi:hypothetical protein DRO58_07290 [Candidatus Bathyarchaeota archaeon]|nr:MAG: hypothetical protein DRO58_07290 [Candidatus Bathyarchaeota archaeon]